MRPLEAMIVLSLASGPSAAEEPVATAVFGFELIDTSLEGTLNGPRQDEQLRLKLITDRLRQDLSNSGKLRVVDTEPVQSRAQSYHLQECGGCDAELARQVGATLSITGTVQKVSNLILNINVYVRSANTGRLLDAMSADMRGNTDESWTRTLEWLVRNRLMAALERIAQ